MTEQDLTREVTITLPAHKVKFLKSVVDTAADGEAEAQAYYDSFEPGMATGQKICAAINLEQLQDLSAILGEALGEKE